MKSWLQRNLNNIIITSFLIPILLVAFVSISHVTTFYSTSNPLSWAIYLSLAVEVAALAALAGISAKFGRFIYIPFGIVTLIQFVGNFFYSYSYIDPTGESFLNWVDMISGFLEPMGVDPTDVVSHRRILALLTGGLIPFISLTFAHMLIVYSNKIQTGEVEVQPQAPIDMEQISKDAGLVEAEMEMEEKINPTPEELEEMEMRLSQLSPKPLSQIVKEDVDGVRRLSYTKNA
jgi:hypothetical protein